MNKTGKDKLANKTWHSYQKQEQFILPLVCIKEGTNCSLWKISQVKKMQKNLKTKQKTKL